VESVDPEVPDVPFGLLTLGETGEGDDRGAPVEAAVPPTFVEESEPEPEPEPLDDSVEGDGFVVAREVGWVVVERELPGPASVTTGTSTSLAFPITPASILERVSVLMAMAAVAVPRTPKTMRAVTSEDFIFQEYKT
jgi:hypothetical protein